ncbi:LytR/AlgR family response regulator transcription factor [Thermoflavifilum thermophilum]|uniref:Two component transcriptional regulator, LytTR family n=1 Tax=Thermoflavifilum thermophilum TaxID=1393122 RepID=A0A1I7NDM4_9BACT|nr:LytTR family DNA-binding domain-containing protein [Thermoflavifilum thermophilum]SFV32788.1 two component transcriptional regulator, LytTR family [Thermoflavifilum thermophilum]
MSTISCYIVDDEFRSIRLVESMLKNHFPEVEVIGSHTDPQSALLQLKHLFPDLLFVDIHMPECDGFSLLQHLPHTAPEIIFITAYEEYALKAFDFHASGYLTKPIQTEKFISCVTRVVEHIQLKKQFFVHEPMHAATGTAGYGADKLILSVGRECVVVSSLDIVFLESMGNYTKVHLLNGSQYLICKQLGRFEQELNALHFCRIHHRYLINLHHVIRFADGLDAEVSMRNGMRLPVSRRQKKNFIHAFQKFMQA